MSVLAHRALSNNLFHIQTHTVTHSNLFERIVWGETQWHTGSFMLDIYVILHAVTWFVLVIVLRLIPLRMTTGSNVLWLKSYTSHSNLFPKRGNSFWGRMWYIESQHKWMDGCILKINMFKYVHMLCLTLSEQFK